MNFLYFREPVEIPPISGLSYLPDCVSNEEQRALTESIDSETWDTSWERRRQPYGASYGHAKVVLRPIPHWGQRLADRISADLGEPPFDQMLVNEYLPGQGIALHRDYQAFDRTVVSLSLLSACVMDFRHPESGRRASMLLEPRSLLVLTGEARNDWQHGIARRKTDRWQGERIPRRRRLSVTFRRLVPHL